MIITRTPFRISFFGGGTDYPVWYRNHGGEVLGAAIDKYCYLTCRYLPPFFEHKIRVVYSKIESCNTLQEIQHPAVREILRFLEITRGVEIHHDGDLPARSGIGSSSSFTVGLLNALSALKGNPYAKHQLALDSIFLEQEVLKETVGSQDQVLAAYGGFNRIKFSPGGTIEVSPVIVPDERLRELSQSCMLFYTGVTRTASDIADTYIETLNSRESDLKALQALVPEALSLLIGRESLARFGELLHESWRIKSSLSGKVSNFELGRMYEAAMEAGAIGGKLTGAGGGGFLLLIVPEGLQQKVRERLQQLIYVPFKFDFSGSQIVFSDHDRVPEQLQSPTAVLTETRRLHES